MWIDESVTIDFEVREVLKDLFRQAEEANKHSNDYLTYYELIETIDITCKNLCADGNLSQKQWDTIMSRYLY